MMLHRNTSQCTLAVSNLFFSLSQRQSGEPVRRPSILVIIVPQCSGNTRIKSEKKTKKQGSEVFWVITSSFCIAVQEGGGAFFSVSPFFIYIYFVLAGSIASCPWKAYSAHSADKGLQGGNREEIVQKV